MDVSELLIFIATGACSGVFLYRWYRLILKNWPPKRSRLTRHVLNWLPAVSLLIIAYTLGALASFDVVDSFLYTIFYIVIGFAWIYLGLTLISLFFDISWIDDAINLNNKSALIAVTGGFLGITLIYSGANIGDGPGWWCVFFAGGLGMVAWFVLGILVNALANIPERITVERDTGCGIRFGAYLIAGGILLGRASSGDWTSFYMTVIEFGAGWPVLPLSALMIAVERYYINKSKTDYDSSNDISSSVIWGVIYILIAVGGVMWGSQLV